MSEKLISTLLIILGVIFIIVFIGADLFGLGGDLKTFGWKQLTGTGVGLLTLLFGIWIKAGKPK
jgi:hypothetical protein